ncbi:hypothetical protein TNCV_2467631 [Trichonephila clavipes]|nr:hypothetical protein TNCV_2467631 [Trichonephila clavipes]
MRAGIKIMCMVVALLFQKLLHESNKMSVPRQSRPLYKSGMKKTILVATLFGTGNRRDETVLARFRSRHTRAQWHVAGLKVYPSCTKCNVTQDNPACILADIGCHKNQLLSSPATALQSLKTHGFMDLV